MITNAKLLLAIDDLILGLGCSIIAKLVILVNINYLQLQVVLMHNKVLHYNTDGQLATTAS